MTPRMFIDADLFKLFGKSKAILTTRYLRELGLFKVGKKGADEQVTIVEAFLFLFVLSIDSGKNPETKNNLKKLLSLECKKWEGSIFNFFANLKGDITALDITLRIAKSLNAVSVSLMQNNEFVFKYPHNEVETSLDHFYYHIDEPFMDEFSSIVCTVTDKHNQTGKSKDDPQSQIGSVKFEELFNQIIDSHPTDEMILERLTQYEER